MDKSIPNLLTEERNSIKIAAFIPKGSGYAVIVKAPFFAETWTLEFPHFVSATRVSKELHHILQSLSRNSTMILGLFWKVKGLSNRLRSYNVLLFLINTG